MTDQIKTELIVEALTKGFETINKDLQDLGKSGKKAGDEVEGGGKKSAMTLKEMRDHAMKAAAAFGIVAGAAVAFKKALDFGEQGAQVIQTTQSWEGLLNQWGVAPDKLDALTSASGGTISNMDAMSSTLTLLAGTTETLGKSLLGNADKLMEIAKAANKLNPALGDTAFMYESINKGIKRSSPLILDNLGIVVKVGKANEDYAKSVGKSTDALTAEEKQLALLNATLEAGGRLIDQVGGNVESATDDYQRLTAETANLKDEFAAWVSGPMANVAQGLTALITFQRDAQNAAKEHAEEITNSAMSYTEYVAEMERANKQLWILSGDTLPIMTESERQAAQAQEELNEQMERWGAIMSDQEDDGSNLATSMQETWDLMADGTREVTDLSDELERLNADIVRAGTGAGESGPKIKKFLDGLDRNIQSPIASVIADLEWWMAGGGQIASLWADVKTAWEQDKITDEEALVLAGGIMEVAENFETEMENIDLTATAENISTSLGIPLDEAYDKVIGESGLKGAFDQLAQIELDFSAFQEMDAGALAAKEALSTLIDEGLTPLATEALPEATAKAEELDKWLGSGHSLTPTILSELLPAIRTLIDYMRGEMIKTFSTLTSDTLPKADLALDTHGDAWAKLTAKLSTARNNLALVKMAWDRIPNYAEKHLVIYTHHINVRGGGVEGGFGNPTGRTSTVAQIASSFTAEQISTAGSAVSGVGGGQFGLVSQGPFLAGEFGIPELITPLGGKTARVLAGNVTSRGHGGSGGLTIMGDVYVEADDPTQFFDRLETEAGYRGKKFAEVS